jgi:hypothetical protein
MLLSWLTGRVHETMSVVRTSTQWVAHFRDNAANLKDIPWQDGPKITPEQLAEIVASLRTWQLGETSDGSHLRDIARKYAERTGDADFVEMIDCFIAEEQRHGATLGRYLDACGVPRAQSNWGDTLFRFFRHCLANMETFTIPVVMAETHALLYYNAIRQATGCPLLRKICEQLLSDEVPHIRMQCERIAILQRNRPALVRSVTMLLQRVFFLGVTLAIWVGHRRALRAGGYGFARFWSVAWRKMEHAWKLMDPRMYQWEAVANDVVECAATST